MLNVGVIGVRSMGQNHARVYSGIGNLLGIADPDNSIGEGVASRFNTKYYSDYNDLLKLPELDAVSIANDPSYHLKTSLAAINAGKHILVEKPLALNETDAQKIVDAAKEQHVTLAVGHIERYNPIIEVTKKILESKQFGDLISIASRRVSSYPPRVENIGVIMDLGIHDIDILRYLVDDKVTSVYTLASTAGNNFGGRKFENHANILIDFKSDVSGFIEVNWLTPMKVRTVSLTCSNNFAVMDYSDQSLEISSSSLMEYDIGDLFQLPQKYDIRMIQVKREEPLKLELQDFINAVENKTNTKITGEDAIETIKIARAAVESNNTKNKIEL
jgi:UDP-N-acetylglucosamine 3-dehydrogenase